MPQTIPSELFNSSYELSNTSDPGEGTSAQITPQRSYTNYESPFKSYFKNKPSPLESLAKNRKRRVSNSVPAAISGSAYITQQTEVAEKKLKANQEKEKRKLEREQKKKEKESKKSKKIRKRKRVEESSESYVSETESEEFTIR